MDMMDRMIAGRTNLLFTQPFFGVLALGLKLREDPTCDTAWVDGVTMGFNPGFIAKLTNDEICALIGHEVMHCANGHPWRREHRDLYLFNVACDKAINTILAGTVDKNGAPVFKLPKGALYSQGPEIGQSAEWIYARLPKQQSQQGGGQGQGQGDTTGQGEVRDAPKDGEDGNEKGDVKTEAEWQQATKTAALAAQAQGKLPAHLKRFAEKAGETKVDWRSTLRRFVQGRAKADYSWSKPSTRYISLGMYLPSLESHELGELAIAVDTSGSIDNVALAQAKAEVMAVIDEMQPSAVSVYYADAAVAQCDRFERGDLIEWRPKGGGGTDFRPVFEACEDQEVLPVCLIYITDLYGTFPKSSELPTIWVTDTDGNAPFGETVRMQ